jgi:hypothetical protein
MIFVGDDWAEDHHTHYSEHTAWAHRQTTQAA